MEALIMHAARPQASASGGQAAAPIAHVPSAADKGAFVRLLQNLAAAGDGGQAIAHAGGDVPFASGFLSMPLLAALFTGEGPERSASLAERLLAALQEDGELAGELLERPLFAEWAAEAFSLLQPAHVPAGEVAPLPEMDREAADAFVRSLIARLIHRLSDAEPDARVTAAAENLNAVLGRLAEAHPALAATGEEAARQTPAAKAEAAMQAADPAPAERRVAAKAEQPEPAIVIRRMPGSETGADSRQLLDRLAHMRPTLVIGAAAVEPGAESAATAKPADSHVPTVTAMPAEAAQPFNAPQTAQPAAPASMPDVPARPADVPTAVVQVRQFAEQMAEFMVKQFAITRSGALSEARITLVPEHLGQLDVKISVQNGTVTATFAAETAGAREMLELQLPALRAALQQQGFQVERLVVSQQQASGPSTGHFQDERQRHDGQQERRQSGTRDALRETDSFEFPLDLETSYGDDAPLRYGSTFHATA